MQTLAGTAESGGLSLELFVDGGASLTDKLQNQKNI
jgi:hypothetical protein